MIKGKNHWVPTVFLAVSLWLCCNTTLSAANTESARSGTMRGAEMSLDEILAATQNPQYNHIDETLELIPRGLLEAQKTKRYEAKIQLLLNGTSMALRKNETTEAKRYWHSLIDIISAKSPSVETGKQYLQFAEFLRINGEPSEAIEQCKIAAMTFRACREITLEIAANQEISHIYAEDGNAEAAINNAEKAISSALAINDLVAIGNAYFAKGISQLILTDNHQRDFGHVVLKQIELIHSTPPENPKLELLESAAMESLETAIDYFSQSGESQAKAECMRLKGDVMLHHHRLEEAKKYYQESYQLFSSSGKGPGFVYLQMSMAVQETLDQKIDTALHTINAAISSNGDHPDTPWIQLLKAEIDLKDFNDPEARDTLLNGLETATKNHDLDQLIALNQLLSLVEINLGNYREGFLALDVATQHQIEQANTERDQVILSRKLELKELEDKIRSESSDRIQYLENQLFIYQSFAKYGWIIILTFAVCGMGLMVLKIRDKREIERKLNQIKNELETANTTIAEAKAERNLVFNNLAQELRTPMNGIVGAIPLLQENNLTNLQQNGLSIIDISSRSITTLINDISDLSYLESGKLKLLDQPVELVQIIETVTQLFETDADHPDVEIICNMPSDPIPELRGDPNRLQQILITLISRAIQSTFEGFVSVKLEVVVPIQERNLSIRVTVEDTSPTPDPEKLKDFFDMTPTLSAVNSPARPSSMVGMSITKKLVQTMKGGIEVNESQFGGICIQILLPFILPPTAEKWHTPEAFERFPRKRALVIDSSTQATKALTRHLRSWGLNFESVEDINSASHLLSSPHGFDVVFLDCTRTRLEFSILEQISIIRSYSGTENTPIILLTRLSDQNLTFEIKRQKYIHHISKPLILDQLHSALSQALHFKSPISKSYAKLTPDTTADDTDLSLYPKSTLAAKGFQFIPYILPMRRDIYLNPDLKILLAEDNVVNQKVTALMLKKMGYDIDIVVNGRKAVEAVTTGNYDVVLMDKIMPIMDGLEASREIRKLETIDQPIIVALTASATMEDEIACRKASMDNFLAKPVRLEKMKAALGFATNVLNERRKKEPVSEETGSQEMT